MGNAAGVRRDFGELEQRRMKAASLFQRGVSQAEVARQLGVGRSSVNRWAQLLKASGRAGLKKAGRAGPKPRLQAAELAAVETALKRGPQELGYEANLWTAPRVARLIEELCGVRYHPRTSGESWGGSVGVASARWAARSSATSKRSSAGNGTAGRSLKKSPPKRAHHCLHRRERTKRAAPPLPHLGAARTDTGAAIPLQLESALGDGRRDLVEVLLPALPGPYSRRRGNRVSQPSCAPYPRAAPYHLGWTAGAPQPPGQTMAQRPGGPYRNRVSASVCSRAQPGGIYLGLL